MPITLTDLRADFTPAEVLSILAHCRGRRIYLLVSAYRASRLLQHHCALPRSLADRLADAYHGQEVIFPKATQELRRWAINRLSGLGLGTNEIAVIIDVTPRTVRRHQKSLQRRSIPSPHQPSCLSKANSACIVAKVSSASISPFIP